MAARLKAAKFKYRDQSWAEMWNCKLSMAGDQQKCVSLPSTTWVHGTRQGQFWNTMHSMPFIGLTLLALLGLLFIV